MLTEDHCLSLLYWGSIGLNCALKTILVTVNHAEPLGGDLALRLRHPSAHCMNHESQNVYRMRLK